MSVVFLSIGLTFLIGSLAIAAAIYFGLTLPFKEKKPKPRRRSQRKETDDV